MYVSSGGSADPHEPDLDFEPAAPLAGAASVTMQRCSARSYTLTALPPAVASCAPSGEKATPATSPVWPRSVRSQVGGPSSDHTYHRVVPRAQVRMACVEVEG